MSSIKFAACSAALLFVLAFTSTAHAAATTTPPTEPLGYGRIYYNGALVIRSPKQTEAAALALCKTNHELNRWVNFRCTWNNVEIYREVGKAEYKIYINGSLRGTTALITRADARANCDLNHKQNKAAAVRCTWNGDVIYDKGPLVPVDTLREYIDGKLFLTSLNLSKAGALERCTFDHTKNFPTKSVRCTWGEIVIYTKGPLAP